MGKKKILVLTSRFPYPPIGGEKLRIFHLVEHLSLRYDVDVCSLFGNEEEIREAEGFKKHCRNLFLFRIPRWRRLWNCAIRILNGNPMQVSYYYDRRIQKRLEALAPANYDHILVHLIRMYEYVRNLDQSKIILEFTDAISMNYYRITIPSNPREFIYALERRRTLAYEIESASRAAAGILVAQTDKDYLVARGCNADKLHVVKNGARLASREWSEYETGSIAFLGNLRSMQNEDMCIHFIRDILPIIRRTVDAHLIVIGANPSAKVLGYHDGEAVTVTGLVEDVEKLLARACLSVCPMRYGAGIQNKILESMALGVPVVTTTIGLEGVDAGVNEEILVADDPDEFAEKVVRLLRDPALRNRMGQKAREFIARGFLWEEQAARYVSVLESTAAPGDSGRTELGENGTVFQNAF